VRDHDDAPADRERLRDDVRVLDDRLAAVLIGERVVVPAGDVAALRLLDDAVGRQPAALDLLSVERDDVAGADGARDRRRNRDEPVARIERGLHAPGLDEAEKHRLPEVLADHERDDDEHRCRLQRQ